MKKSLIVFSSLALACSSLAQAAPMTGYMGDESGGGSAIAGVNFYIPPETKEVVPESDLVQVACYEAKYRGGEAIANFEALEETLGEALASLDQFGAQFKAADYLGDAGTMRDKMESICQAGSLDEVKTRVEEFQTSAIGLKGELEVNLKGKLKTDIENFFEGKKEEMRKQLEEEMRAEAEKKGEEIKARLEAEAEAEAKSEAEQIKQRIQAEIEAQMTAQYAGQEGVDVGQLQEQGRKMGEERGKAEGEVLRAKLEAKYQQKAEEEKAKLQAEIEKQGEAKGEELKKISENFDGIEEKMKARAEEKKQEWEQYKDKSAEAIGNIVKKVIERQFDLAKELIEEKRAELDLAFDQAQSGDYAQAKKLMTADQLVELLERDRAEVIANFSTGVPTPADIEAAKSQFKEKWEALREKMELAKLQGISDIIGKVIKYTDWNKIKTGLQKNISHFDSRKSSYAKRSDWCKNHPEALTSKTSNCASCRALSDFKEVVDYEQGLSGEIKSAMALIDQLGAKKTAAANNQLSLEEALAFKNQIQTAFTSLKSKMDNEYPQVVKNYEAKSNQYAKQCAGK